MTRGNSRRLSRRMVLRAAGAAVALPWLESLPTLAAGREPSNPFPTRFAVLVMGNGVSGNHWWAQGDGAAMRLGRSLQPLEPLKQKINVINGLFNEPSVGRGIHPAQTGNLLSGAPLSPGPAVRAGITVDQVLASHLGKHTTIPGLVLATEPAAIGCHDSGYSMAYSSRLSWRDGATPIPATTDPQQAFDRLFAIRPGGSNRSVLDRVSDGAGRLARTVSASDRTTLDGYFTAVRDVERRLDRMRNGADDDLRDRVRLTCDIVALAFQSDTTRVASLLLARDLSALEYPFLDVRDDHHSASHDDLSDAYERIVRFHVRELARLAARLDAMPEGDGTVLDNCCLLWLSNMWSGWKHDNRKLPVVTCGGLGGTLATGRSLDYLYAGDGRRRLCSLYLSIMDRMGVALDRFGDAETRLAGF